MKGGLVDAIGYIFMHRRIASAREKQIIVNELYFEDESAGCILVNHGNNHQFVSILNIV